MRLTRLVRGIAKARAIAPVALAAVGSLVVVGIVVVSGPVAPDVGAALLRGLMVVLVAAVCFVLDDDARPATTSLPVSARRVDVLALALASGVVTIAWLLMLAAAPLLVGQQPSVPAWYLMIEPYAILAPVALLGRILALTGRTRIGVVLVPIVLLVVVVIASMPPDYRMFPSLDDEAFMASRPRWLVVLVLASAGHLVVDVLCCPTRWRLRLRRNP